MPRSSKPLGNFERLSTQPVPNPAIVQGAIEVALPRDEWGTTPVRQVMGLLAGRGSLPVEGGGHITRDAVLARLIDPQG